MPDSDPSYSNHSVQWSNLNCSIKFKNWLTAVKFAIACRHSLLMNELSTIIPCIWLLHLLCIRFYTGFIFLTVVDPDMIKMNVLLLSISFIVEHHCLTKVSPLHFISEYIYLIYHGCCFVVSNISMHWLRPRPLR